MADDPAEPGGEAAQPDEQDGGAAQANERPRGRRDSNHPLGELASRAGTLAFVLASVAIDLLFIAAWGFLNSLFDEHIIHRLRLAGFNKFSLVVFEVVFSVSTLFSVCIYIAKDLRRIYHRIWDEP